VTPSQVVLTLLGIVAPIGAFDVLYFHVWKFRLFARPASRAETATHVVRSVLIGVVALLLAEYEPRGRWYLAVTALLALDFANTLLDVWLEPASRKDLGGVPRLEYLIHVIGATAGGAVLAAFVALGRGLATLPTELHPTTLPGFLVWNARAIAVGCLAFAGIESYLVLRALSREGRGREDARLEPEPS